MKKNFKPVITSVKLNPEQAVLTCDCYNGTSRFFGEGLKKSAGSHVWEETPDIFVCDISSTTGSKFSRTWSINGTNYSDGHKVYFYDGVAKSSNSS